MGLADDRKPVNLMTVHVSKSVTVHEVSNTLFRSLNCFHYTRKHKGLRTGTPAGFVILPMPVWRCDGHRAREI